MSTKINTLEGNLVALGKQLVPVSRSLKKQVMHRVIESKPVKRY